MGLEIQQRLEYMEGKLVMAVQYICDGCKKKTSKESLIHFRGRAMNESSKKRDRETQFDLCKECLRKIIRQSDGGEKTK